MVYSSAAGPAAHGVGGQQRAGSLANPLPGVLVDDKLDFEGTFTDFAIAGRPYM